jgi:FtsP/CotA-like multicopper oxidase with cupredoxin domain
MIKVVVVVESTRAESYTVVHVTNSMQNNGTSIHFHGIRQNYTNPMDGVAAITQCPTAPGDSITYTWRATQYGSSWYHSHFYVQAWDGIAGGIVINGPGKLYTSSLTRMNTYSFYSYCQL